MFRRKNLMLTGLLFVFPTFPTLLGRKEVTFIIFKFFLPSLTLTCGYRSTKLKG